MQNIRGSDLPGVRHQTQTQRGAKSGDNMLEGSSLVTICLTYIIIKQCAIVHADPKTHHEILI
jgi:hypothetical protein